MGAIGRNHRDVISKGKGYFGCSFRLNGLPQCGNLCLRESIHYDQRPTLERTFGAIIKGHLRINYNYTIRNGLRVLARQLDKGTGEREKKNL